MLVIDFDVKIGDERSLHVTCFNLRPDSTSFIMSDQSGRLRGRTFSFSNICLCFSEIGFFSNSGGGAKPGGGGGGGGAPVDGGGGGGGGGGKVAFGGVFLLIAGDAIFFGGD